MNLALTLKTSLDLSQGSGASSCFYFFLRLVPGTYLHVFSKIFVVVFFLFCFVLNDVLTHQSNECCLNKKEQIYSATPATRTQITQTPPLTRTESQYLWI